jgi:hypothetical protein
LINKHFGILKEVGYGTESSGKDEWMGPESETVRYVKFPTLTMLSLYYEEATVNFQAFNVWNDYLFSVNCLNAGIKPTEEQMHVLIREYMRSVDESDLEAINKKLEEHESMNNTLDIDINGITWKLVSILFHGN